MITLNKVDKNPNRSLNNKKAFAAAVRSAITQTFCSLVLRPDCAGTIPSIASGISLLILNIIETIYTCTFFYKTSMFIIT